MVQAWEDAEGDRLIAAVNFADHQSQCYVSLPFDDLAGRRWVLQRPAERDELRAGGGHARDAGAVPRHARLGLPRVPAGLAGAGRTSIAACPRRARRQRPPTMSVSIDDFRPCLRGQFAQPGKKEDERVHGADEHGVHNDSPDGRTAGQLLQI